MNGKPKNWLKLLLISVVLLVTPIVFCVGYPRYTVALTGVNCLDFVSGHVPPQAEDRYFKLIFTAAVEENYEWLETVLDEEIVVQFQEFQPYISVDYQTIAGDDLAGFYDRLFQFEDGNRLDVTYYGIWSECPDFEITDKEILNTIELTQIKVIIE